MFNLIRVQVITIQVKFLWWSQIRDGALKSVSIVSFTSGASPELPSVSKKHLASRKLYIQQLLPVVVGLSIDFPNNAFESLHGEIGVRYLCSQDNTGGGSSSFAHPSQAI